MCAIAPVLFYVSLTLDKKANTTTSVYQTDAGAV